MEDFSETRYRNLFESVRDLVYTLSADGVITSLNPAFDTLTGWSRDEWIGRPVNDLIHPDDHRAVIHMMERALRGMSSPLCIIRVCTRSGQYRYMECSSTQQRIDNQSPRVLGVARDITERMLAEQALRDSEERFRQVVENIREVFWLSDPHKSQILYVSQGYEQVWGRTCESLYASPRSWLDSIHPEDRLRVTEAALTKQTEGVYDETYRIVRPDGSIRWIHDRAFPLRDRFGQVYRISGIAEDITKQRFLEDTLHDLTVSLEGIREEERRRISLDLHDELGQTLSTIKLYLGWMMQSLAKENFSEQLPLWQSRLTLVIQDVDQALASVEKLCFQLRPAALDQLGLPAAVKLQVAQFAKHTGIVCNVNITLDDKKVSGDQVTALFRILQEALTNVSRHARATHVGVHLTMVDSRVKLEVRDDGIGIGERHINDRHSLGLLGIRERLRPFGGELEITGSPGDGTALIVWLPIT